MGISNELREVPNLFPAFRLLPHTLHPSGARQHVGSQFPIIVVQSLNCIQLFATPWTAACQASLSFTTSRSLLKLMLSRSVMPSNHLVLCHPLLLLPSIFPSIRVFFNESAQCIRSPKYWSFSFSISPSKEFPDQGSNPHQLHWKCKVLTTGLSGKFLFRLFERYTSLSPQFLHPICQGKTSYRRILLGFLSPKSRKIILELGNKDQSSQPNCDAFHLFHL